MNEKLVAVLIDLKNAIAVADFEEMEQLIDRALDLAE